MRPPGDEGDDDDPRQAAWWDAVEEATELLRDREYDAAMAELRGVLDRDPSNAYAHHFLAAAHFERGEFDAARAGYERALERAPRYLGALVGLGHALRMSGRLDEAVRAGERALALGRDPTGDPDAHYLLALVYTAKGSTRKAISHLESFIASNPEVEAKYDAQALLDTLKGNAKKLEPV